MPDTLIIVPTYNEKDNIKELISEILRYTPGVNILIVDDNSSDGTGVIADDIAAKDRRVSVMHRLSRRGRGYAGIDAFKEALKREEASFIMEMDSDFSHDPKYIPHFIREMNGNDIVIGSRFVEGGSDIYRSFLRNLLSRLSNIFIRRYLKLDVKDCSAGYRCFKRHVIESIDLDSLISRGPAIIEEVLYISKAKGFRIKEIPIVFKDRIKGRTKLSVMKLLRVFLDIWSFRHIHLPDINIKKAETRSFGFKVALGLSIAGFIMFLRGKEHFLWFTGAGSLFLVLGVLCPYALISLKRFLDFFISAIGRVIKLAAMLVLFFLIFSPIAVILKILRKDILMSTIGKTSESYWIKTNSKVSGNEYYERMG